MQEINVMKIEVEAKDAEEACQEAWERMRDAEPKHLAGKIPEDVLQLMNLVFRIGFMDGAAWLSDLSRDGVQSFIEKQIDEAIIRANSEES